ncbi:TetR/AcrR family transcriptional regulator [Burkholderia sp. Ac-20365]|uniref:TetR/AcrR family transcriptional regulator n=1 Tax=Burkholderia sp. Ac-20365 TaxID=2703897 RepID=UPI00197C8530|nr:TetR/AcrR family transcriptional regulator [Burkholderia sp. Ac-20365]MBN3766116.1 TetR/AcrR family transcriptional regulator [Burkholderia sp. Ac-20365]
MARPREFDEDYVIGQALHVFWEKGYDSTSLADLQQVTGLTKSSLYKAFESKEGLFRRVVERYHRDYLGFRVHALAQPTPKRVAQALLDGMVELHTGKNTPPGCLVTLAALACSADARPLGDELSESRSDFERRLRARFETLKDAGPLPAGMTNHDAAAFVSTLIQGLAVQGRGGATRRQLRQLVAAVLNSWPDNEPGAPKRAVARAKSANRHRD